MKTGTAALVMQNVEGRPSEADSQDSQDAHVGSNIWRDSAKLVDASRTKFQHLEKLIYAGHFLSDKEQTEHFDVFYSHLLAPIDLRQFEMKLSFPLVLYSLIGIINLGTSYFGRDSTHKEGFSTCWPHVSKWLKFIVDGRHFFGCEEEVFLVASKTFRLASSVYEAALGKDDAFELAVNIWNGCTSQAGTDCFAGQPILICLCCEIENDNRMNYIMDDFKDGTEGIVDNILSRIKHAAFQSSPMDVQTLLCLAGLMGILEARRKESNLMAIFLSNTGPFLVTIINALLNASCISASRIAAARLFCTPIVQCMALGPVHTKQMVEAGILDTLLKVASIEDPKSVSQQSSCDVLWTLLRSLLYDDVVVACQKELDDLYSSGLPVKDLLRTSSNSFYALWKMFETAVLEQSTLLHLFEAGYAPEIGMCANLACHKEALLSRFKPCSGCSFAIYCSKSCQRADRSHHKDGCKKIAEESPDAFANEFSRFSYRMASLQINRHYYALRLMNMGLGRRARSEDLAFHINCSHFQFEIEPFNYHELLDDSKHPPRHVMVANEVHRRLSENIGRRCVMVVLRIGETELPFIVNVSSAGKPEEGWTKKIPNAPFIGLLEHDKLPMFKNHCQEPLVGEYVDALRATARYAIKYSKELAVPVWSEEVLKKATLSVMSKFDEELRTCRRAIRVRVRNENQKK